MLLDIYIVVFIFIPLLHWIRVHMHYGFIVLYFSTSMVEPIMIGVF